MSGCEAFADRPAAVRTLTLKILKSALWLNSPLKPGLTMFLVRHDPTQLRGWSYLELVRYMPDTPASVDEGKTRNTMLDFAYHFNAEQPLLRLFPWPGAWHYAPATDGHADRSPTVATSRRA